MQTDKKIVKWIMNVAFVVGIGALIAAILGRSQHFLTAGMLIGVYLFYNLINVDVEDYD